MNEKARPYLALAAGTLAFSTSGALTKLCTAPAITIAFWVRFFSLAYLIGALLAHQRSRSSRLLIGAAKPGLAGGVLFGFHILTYFWALKLTSVTVVFLLSSLNPAVVGMFGFFLLGEQMTRKQAGWTVLAIAAAIFVVVARDASGSIELFGNTVALISALGYCAYFLISRHARRTVGTLEYLVVSTAASILVIGAVAALGGVSVRIDRGPDLWLVAMLGLIPGTIGHLTVNWALRHVEAYAASTVLLAVPLFASLWAHLFVGERVSLVQIVSGLVVLAAIPGAIRRDAAGAWSEKAMVAEACERT